jgi:hypothetical protein
MQLIFATRSIPIKASANQNLSSALGHDALTVFAVIGGIASCLALWAYITGFRNQRTFNRWVASQEIQQQTGDKEKELRSLSEVISDLQSQINHDVPREAERIYLSNRLDSLTRTLGEQYDEYKKISDRLSVLSADSDARTLSKPILQIIERAVVPGYKARERRDRQSRVLLIILLILLVIPGTFSPGTLIDDEFIITFGPGAAPEAAVFWASLAASIILAIVMRWAGVRWVIPAVAKAQRPRARTHSCSCSRYYNTWRASRNTKKRF